MSADYSRLCGSGITLTRESSFVAVSASSRGSHTVGASSLRSSLIAIAIAIGACSSALATSSISFEAQGYLLDIVVGTDSQPSVAGVSIAMPGSVRNVAIPMRNIRVEVFDTKQKVLLLRFTNPGDSTLPKDFSLSVRNDAGVLQIDGKSIAGRFSWEM